jgi:hypothetical protein
MGQTAHARQTLWSCSPPTPAPSTLAPLSAGASASGRWDLLTLPFSLGCLRPSRRSAYRPARVYVRVPARVQCTGGAERTFPRRARQPWPAPWPSPVPAPPGRPRPPHPVPPPPAPPSGRSRTTHTLQSRRRSSHTLQITIDTTTQYRNTREPTAGPGRASPRASAWCWSCASMTSICCSKSRASACACPGWCAVGAASSRCVRGWKLEAENVAAAKAGRMRTPVVCT